MDQLQNVCTVLEVQNKQLADKQGDQESYVEQLKSALTLKDEEEEDRAEMATVPVAVPILTLGHHCPLPHRLALPRPHPALAMIL